MKRIISALMLYMVTQSAHAAGCGELEWKAKDLSTGQTFQTEKPGYFDVGLGYASIDNVAGGLAASGILATIKVYPCGKWYAVRKGSTPKEAAEKVVRAAANPSDTAAMAAAEIELRGLFEDRDIYPLVGEEWKHRFSIFYGRSLGNFDPTSIEGEVNAIGIGFDIAPEFAVVGGRAMFRTKGAAGDTGRWMIGVQMNFSAFSAFRDLGK
ncbi:hypothetical protein [Sideroxyarcus sp. TK5]